MAPPLVLPASGTATHAALSEMLARADPAGDERSEGALDHAARAIVLARAVGDDPARARAQAWHCVHLFRLGRHDAVVDEARAALAGLQAQRLVAEERELLRVLALAANETARFDLALESAQLLVNLAGTADEPGSALAASFVLAASLERIGDSWQAIRVLSQALDESPDAPLRERMLARNGLLAMGIGLFHRLRDIDPEGSRGQLEQARVQGQLALELQQRADDPIYAVTVSGNLGEVLLHLGELDEAGRLLTEARERGRVRQLHAHVWRITASLAEWHLASGQAEAAWDEAVQLIQSLGALAPQQTLVRLHGAAYRAAKALGRHADALLHLEAGERIERQRTISQLQAQSRLFVTKGELERVRRDAQRQRARAAELAQDAARDPLTGIGNRRHLDQRFEQLVADAHLHDRPLAVALLDLDHFKRINDTLGHAAGDRVLVALARLLGENVRERDVLARMGGEEFVIVLPEMSAERAVDVCSRLAERIRTQAWPGGAPERVTASIGIAASTPQAPLTPAELLQRADEALYEAKRTGRDRVLMK
ncbi:MAG: GGDEF domain-containing protein [Rubrivivax sp.]|nr:GGDEF domain-containing protein [Rubrivivax sp.]